jgi:hypothetical protein
MEHEEAFIRAFITPNKRTRYLEKLGSPKTRAKFIAEHLYHLRDLDQRFAQRIDPHLGAKAARIDELLRDHGAPARCYLISTMIDLDGREGDLSEVLQKVVGSFEGTFISCIPGHLAYYEGEYENDRYLCRRQD